MSVKSVGASPSKCVNWCEVRNDEAALLGELLRGWSVSKYGSNSSMLGLKCNRPCFLICHYI